MEIGGTHKPFANQPVDPEVEGNKYGNVMLKIPRFYYKWEEDNLLTTSDGEGTEDVEVVQIEAGENHVALRLSNGMLWTAGDNTYLQLGWTTEQAHPNGFGLATIDYQNEAVIDVSCGFNHTVCITEHRVNGTRNVYTFGDNTYGQCGIEPTPQKEIGTISANVNWHDNTVYDNNDNTYNEELNNGRFTIRECLDVECGSYHTQLIYSTGTIPYDPLHPNAINHQFLGKNIDAIELQRLEDQLKLLAEIEFPTRAEQTQIDELVKAIGKFYSWPTVLINCGRNIHGELCRGISSDSPNGLAAVILGGKNTKEGRLYPEIISSGVYHTLLTTIDVPIPMGEVRTTQRTECENRYIWDYISHSCVPDPEEFPEICGAAVDFAKENGPYEITAVFYYDTKINPGHNCNRAKWNATITTASGKSEDVTIDLNNAPSGGDRYGGEVTAHLLVEDITESKDCKIIVELEYIGEGDPHEGIECFDCVIKNGKGKMWFARALFLEAQPSNKITVPDKRIAHFVLNVDTVFNYDTFNNYQNNTTAMLEVVVANAFGTPVTVTPWTNSFLDYKSLNNKVLSVGTNHYGQLGRPSDDWFDNQLGEVDISDLRQIETGWGSTAFVKNNGELWTCGANYDGQLGRVVNYGTNKEINLGDNHVNIKDAKMGYKHLVYIAMDNTVYYHGASDILQVATNTKAKVIGVGNNFIGLITLDNKYYCAGNNERGILGRETPSTIAETDIQAIIAKTLAETEFAQTATVTQRFSLVRSLKEGDKYWYDLQVEGEPSPEKVLEEPYWDTFHVWNSRLVDFIYMSLFPGKIYNNVPMLMAFSHCIPDDPTTEPKSSYDESHTPATFERANTAVRNIGKKYRLLTYEHVTMLRMLAIMMDGGEEDISRFFGTGDIPAGTAGIAGQDQRFDDRVRTPIIIDGIRILPDKEIEHKFDVYLKNIYSSKELYRNVFTYRELLEGTHYTQLYGGNNILKLLPKRFLEEIGEKIPNSSINMDKIGDPPMHTGLLSLTMGSQFDLKQILPTDELPFYFVAYGKGEGQLLDANARYEIENVYLVKSAGNY